MTDFDPRYPPTTNSLNRVRLELALLPDDVRGQTGYGLLSTSALNALILPHTNDVAEFYEQAALGIDWAVEIAHTLGTRLGCLLLTLTHPDEHNRQANPDKPAGYWSHWSGIRTAYPGGGLVRGKVGEIIAAQAQATVGALASESDYRVVRAEHPQYLPLMGAARIIQSGSRASVLDFGGSFVKRAIAHYTDGELCRLQIQDALSNDLSPDEEDARLIFERMADIIVQSCAVADAATIPISIAAYVDEHGQPLNTQGGIYMRLAQLTPDVPAALSQAVSERLGNAVEVKLLHDGTAAALFYVPDERAAVIMLGTALGSGYAVMRSGLPLCRVSPTLIVE